MSEITDVVVEPLNLSLKEPFEISLGTQHEAENILVRVKTDTGAVGYGEGAPVPSVTGETQSASLATAKAATKLIIGRDVANYRSLITDLRSSLSGNAAANLAVETAILDAYCRERNIALSELFGGRPAQVTTDLTIPILPSDEAYAAAERTVADGFEHLKIKTGNDVYEDIERVVAVSESAPDAHLKVDANQGWTPKETGKFANAMADRNISLDLIEQPVPKEDIDGLARTRERVDVPIAADESIFTPTDALAIVQAGAADIINVKIGKSGLLAIADIISIAQAANLELMIGCMLESAIAIHTSTHIVAGTDAFSYIDLDGNLLLADDVADLGSGPSISPTGPGHGIIPD